MNVRSRGGDWDAEVDGAEGEGSVVVVKVVEVGGEVVWCGEVEVVGAVKQAGARNVDLVLVLI